jgi:hypothetical protein
MSSTSSSFTDIADTHCSFLPESSNDYSTTLLNHGDNLYEIAQGFAQRAWDNGRIGSTIPVSIKTVVGDVIVETFTRFSTTISDLELRSDPELGSTFNEDEISGMTSSLTSLHVFQYY